MTLHHFQPTHYHTTLGWHAPVLTIADGDSVVTTTVDAHGVDRHGVEVAARPNPMTGPFYVEGAQPGDTLAVHFDRITPNRATGWSRNALAANTLDPGFVPQMHPSEHIEWQVDVAAGFATWGRLRLPLAPMLGCFGVAPEGGQALSTATSSTNGGNMDYRGFRAGTTVYLPVYAPGALFHLGDGHALQGDGEIVGTGIEISCEVQFSVKLLKGKPIFTPHGEDETHIFTVGNARPLDQALQHATTALWHWLKRDYGFDGEEAATLMGMCVEYEVGNVFDPAYTMVCKLTKRWLPA